MKFPNYDCQKVGFVKFGDNSDQDIYHDEALKKADNRKCKFKLIKVFIFFFP